MTAPTALPIVSIDSLYAATGAAVAFTACDATNDNTFVSTGREVVLVKNASADTAHASTIVSVPDALGRSGDITQSLPFGTIKAYMPGLRGFRDSNGLIRLHPAHADIQYCILRLPT